MEEERSLGDPAQPDAETFDVGGWASGVRGTRRAVLMFLDEQAVEVALEMDVIAETIDVLPAGDQRDTLIDSYDELRSQLLASATKVVVEGRGRERRKEVEKRAREIVGSDVSLRSKKSEDLTDAERDQMFREEAQVMCHVVADHIVEPDGISGEDLWRMWHVRESEVDKLVRVTAEVDSQALIDSSVVTRDFSQRRSVRR